jgi:diguanylate cyclase (GGDEF)-like protein
MLDITRTESANADQAKEEALSAAYAALDDGRLYDARDHAQAVLATLDGTDQLYEARALLCLAHCDRISSKLRRGCETARRAARLFEQLGDVHGEANALATLAHVAMLLGRNEEAVEAAILSTRLCDTRVPQPQAVLAYNCLGLAYCWSGDHARADASLERAVEVAKGCLPMVSIYQPRLNQVWVEASRLVDERYQTGQMKSLTKLGELLHECAELERAGKNVSVSPGLQSLARTISFSSKSLLESWRGNLSAASVALESATSSLSHVVTWLDSFVRWCAAELAWAKDDWARTENELNAMRETALVVEHEQLACMADLLLAQVYEIQNKSQEVRSAYRTLRRRERRVLTEGLGSRESLVSWRLGARQSERHLQQALALSQQFQQWSLEDALTGIPNRRHFVQKLAELMTASNFIGRPLTVAMVDVDKFKLVNDRFSHGVGDRVLKTVASIMTSEMRQSDTPARWAGDEFVILFDDTTEPQAAQISERIREAVVAFDWESIAPGLHVSVSIGVSEVRPIDTVESLLHRSDESMYQRKLTAAPALVN